MTSDLFPGIGISGYRSFGQELAALGPLDRITTIIGPNNSGKSNLLLLLSVHLERLHTAASVQGELDYLDGSVDRHSVNREFSDLRLLWPLDVRNLRASVNESKWAHLDALLEDDLVTFGTEIPMMPFVYRFEQSAMLIDPDWLERLMEVNGPGDTNWLRLRNMFVGSNGSQAKADAIDSVVNHLHDYLLAPPKPVLVPAERGIADGDSHEWLFSGAGLVAQLRKLKNPRHDEWELEEDRKALERFMRGVLQDETFEWIVPDGMNDVNVRLQGEVRPLRSMGTGIGHLFLIVAATTLRSGHLVCIEEPEVHLHPALQKRLALHLSEHTTSQLVISTHSSTLMNSLDGTTIRLRHVDGCTRVTKPVGSEYVELLGELGYRASDLLLANCVIWVEGPSDRIYIKAWLSWLAPALVEGVHYSVIFFGGSLLSHLTAEEYEPDDPSNGAKELVALRRLNSHLALVTDSDRQDPSDPLKPAVARLQREIEASEHSLVWVTEGRTIENYVPASVLSTAVQSVHPTVVGVSPAKQFEYALTATTSKGTLAHPNKVEIAKSATAAPWAEMPLDLRDRVEALRAFIEAAN